MEKFLKIKNQTATTADLYIYGDIVTEASWWDEGNEIHPELVRNFLDETKGKELNIYINSGGGSVFAGLAIYNMLKRHEGQKNVHVDGVAASIASIIAMAGDKITIPSNAFLMIHSPWTMVAGNAAELRKQADDLDRIEEGLLAIYEENIKEGASMEDIKQMVKDETWLSGTKASEYFNVELGSSLEAVACVKGEVFNRFKYTPDEILNDSEQEIEEISQNVVVEEKEEEIIEQHDEELETLQMMIDLL